jgi:threonine dehydrogenase-like Zn-dependent dehydrogenase
MKGRAAVTLASGPEMELTEYEVPEPGADEVLVEVMLASICGSDLHMWRGEIPWFQPAPGIQGHEMTGRVAKLGSNRTTDSLGRPLREGDRVAYAYFIPCGQCWACLGGTTGCPNRYRTRTTVTADDPPHFLGAYAEYYLLKAGQWIFKVPDELPDELVAPVNCALSQVVYGLHQIGVWLGDTVVVQGAGGLGIYTCAVAKDMGAGRVIAIDGIPQRLELAQEFGADEVIDLREHASKEARVQKIKELTGGVGTDVCVEVVGVASVVQEGLEMTRVGGRYLWMGNIVPGARAEIVPHDAVRQPKSIRGVLAYDRWVLPRALDWVNRCKERYPFEKLVGASFPLDQINEAFRQAEWTAGEGSVARTVIAPRAET